MNEQKKPVESTEQQVHKDYEVTRKVIYKGVMAPKGKVYLQVALKKKDVKGTIIRYKMCKLIKGHQAPEVEAEIASYLRARILEKYKV